nr:unnamed protein product [Digitaria exilis]
MSGVKRRGTWGVDGKGIYYGEAPWPCATQAALGARAADEITPAITTTGRVQPGGPAESREAGTPAPLDDGALVVRLGGS